MNKVIRMKFRKILYNVIGKRLPLSHGRIQVGQKNFRLWCVKGFCKSVGEIVNIEKGAYIPNDLTIGDNSGIGVNSEIGSGTYIGDNVMMGPDCIIFTTSHKHDRTDIPIGKQGMTDVKPVHIGNNCWIGTRVIIMPGVTIGEGSIIGAGAVVTRDIPSNVIAAGVPAKVIKNR